MLCIVFARRSTYSRQLARSYGVASIVVSVIGIALFVSIVIVQAAGVRIPFSHQVSDSLS